MNYSRRGFITSGLVASAFVPLSAEPTQEPSRATAPPGPSTVLDVDFRKLVSRADLQYTKPVERSEEGQPVGNGRIGSLVWTTPSALKFQINRVDVFAENRSTNSFPERHTDYGSGCGFVDIDFVDFGDDVFDGPAFEQHLSVYDGLMTVKGQGVTAQILASTERDVIAIGVDDRCPRPRVINIDLRMLRYVVQYIDHENYDLSRQHAVKVVLRNHSATSALAIRNGRIILTQQYREGDYYNSSAVAIGVVGRRFRAKIANDSTVRLAVAPGNGRFTIHIASSASFEASEDVAARGSATTSPPSAGIRRT
jgi:hypothetical protein